MANIEDAIVAINSEANRNTLREGWELLRCRPLCVYGGARYEGSAWGVRNMRCVE